LKIENQDCTDGNRHKARALYDPSLKLWNSGS
jgi:hypothetical protein